MDTDVDEIFQLVKKKVREQAAYERDAYLEIVDETIEYFREKGKITDEDNDEFIRDQLLDMWELVQNRSANEDY